MFIAWGPLWFVLPVTVLYLVYRAVRKRARQPEQQPTEVSTGAAKQASSDRLRNVAAMYDREREARGNHNTSA